MKHLLSILLLFILSFSSKAQQNLVPNPSFEDTVYCPFALNQFGACKDWMNFGNSPDYFNACASNGLNVPNAVFGYQNAHSGNGMAGEIIYRRPNSPAGPNYREFIGVQLRQSCVVGQKYYFSCYINFGGQLPVSIACNKFGANFSTQPYDSSYLPPLNNNPVIFSDSVFSDTTQWLRISHSFIADSSYNYLSLGNFFMDINTDTINFGQFPDNSYYYVDDICLTTDSIFNQTWTGLNDFSEEFNLDIFPNPTSTSFHMESSSPFYYIELISKNGNKIYNWSIELTNNYHFQLPTFLQDDLYFIKVYGPKYLASKKILIQH